MFTMIIVFEDKIKIFNQIEISNVYMSQLKMDLQTSSIKHLPVKVNNCVKRRQEDTNKTSKWSVVQFYLKKFHKLMF